MQDDDFYRQTWRGQMDEHAREAERIALALLESPFPWHWWKARKAARLARQAREARIDHQPILDLVDRVLRS